MEGILARHPNPNGRVGEMAMLPVSCLRVLLLRF